MKATLRVIAILFMVGCAAPGNKKAEIEQLLQSDEIQRNAHMNNDATLLVSQLSDTLITVQNGEVSKAPKESIKQRFSTYFEQVTYRKWDNISPPIIHISDDAMLASVTVNKITETKNIPAPDSTYSVTVFAWTSLYRKENNQWKIYSITSTREITN